MDVMLQRHCARYIYVVPEGLRELMSDISREVLRSQPENIYPFIADYLDALMITRENARVAARLVQNVCDMAETTVRLLETAGMDRKEADKVVASMQAILIQHIESKPPDFYQPAVPEHEEELRVVTAVISDADIPRNRMETAAKIIQTAYRNFKHSKEHEHELLAGMIDWRVAARTAMRLYRKTGVSREEANRAATLIKAAYKGYYTRRIMKRLKEEVATTETVEDVLQLGVGEEDEYIPPEEDQFTFTPLEEKAVKIDYTTVIPHVDFKEPDVVPSSPSSQSATLTATKILSELLAKVVPSEQRLETLVEAEEGSLSYVDTGDEGGEGGEEYDALNVGYMDSVVEDDISVATKIEDVLPLEEALGMEVPVPDEEVVPVEVQPPAEGEILEKVEEEVATRLSDSAAPETQDQ